MNDLKEGRTKEAEEVDYSSGSGSGTTDRHSSLPSGRRSELSLLPLVRIPKVGTYVPTYLPYLSCLGTRT